MQWRNTPTRFGAAAQLFHWGMFVALAVQLIVGQIMDGFAKGTAQRDTAFAVHGTLGVLVFAFMLARLAWRIVDGVPVPVGPAWQRRAATLLHGVLYLLIVALPITGYLTYSAQGHPTAFFAWELPPAVAPDRALAKTFENIHSLLGDALMVVVALHAAAALWHHFFMRDDTLRRMLRGRSADGARRGG
jgi:superoxide oxidase